MTLWGKGYLMVGSCSLIRALNANAIADVAIDSLANTDIPRLAWVNVAPPDTRDSTLSRVIITKIIFHHPIFYKQYHLAEPSTP